MELTPELLKDILHSALNAKCTQETQIQEPMFQVRPPESFDFQDPATWANWVKRFKMFRSASGLSSRPETQQVNMLLYSMGQEKIRQAIKEDKMSETVRNAIESGDWSNLENTEFFKERGSLAFTDGLILKGMRIFIPRTLRDDILGQIHSGHLGVNKCLARSRESVWWPGLSVEIKRMVENCPSCLENRSNPAEPLIPTTIPNRPWEVVGTDLFEYNKKVYICMQDYFSKYVELITLNSINTNAIKQAYLSIFSRHGIPSIVKSDNGTALISAEMKVFARELGFEIVTSSPHFPQSNGQAERAVEICKGILKRNKEPYLGLLAHRASPLNCGVSPAELLFGRKIRSTLPSVPERLHPHWPDLEKYRRDYEMHNAKNKQYYDRRHRARNLSILQQGNRVWITDLRRYGTVTRQGSNVRDYIVESNGNHVRRNRRFLIPATIRKTIKSPCLRYPNIGVPNNGREESWENAERGCQGKKGTGEPKQDSPKKANTTTTGNTTRGLTANGRYFTMSGREVKPPHRYQF